MDKVRLGIIGTGVMGQGHLANLPQISNVELTAICDNDADVLAEVGKNFPVNAYSNHRDLIAAGVCDAVLIATPHYDHPPIAIDSFHAGLHVLSEKPIAVHTKAAKEALAVHAQYPQLKYGIVFMARAYPLWIQAREILQKGQIGEIRRVSRVMTNWFRTQAYYDSGGWRATWAGEGGGALINQCPHTLDILTWLTGLPKRVTAIVGIGKHHHIEVEDEVSALLEYDNGAIGHFVTSTGETPGIDRLEIVGDRGRMTVENGKITLVQTRESVRHYIYQTDNLYLSPETDTEEIVPPSIGFGHVESVQNFVNAVRDGEPLLAPAEEGLKSLTLSNAMVLSGLKKRPVEIPFNDDEYRSLIEELAAHSAYKKTVRKATDANRSGSVH